MILPFLEQQVVFNACNYQVDNCLNGWVSSFPRTYLDVNATAFVTKISAYLCPSEAYSPPDSYWAYTNYKANFGTSWNLQNVTDGPFFITSRLTPSDDHRWSEPDGGLQRACLRDRAGRGRYTRPDDDVHHPAGQHLDEPGRSRAVVRGSEPSRCNHVLGGDKAWGFADFKYRHVFTPNHVTCFEYFGPADHVYGISEGAYIHMVNPPTSYHSSGVNVLFLDGSVHFVKQTIDRATWRATGTRAGGEVVSGSEY